MNHEDALLAPYAMHSENSAGRAHPEQSHPYRSPFQRDRDRIVHSSAFRRLAHKTQVFTGELGDYHRSRLTHTLEVASIARTIGRVLRLNEDFIEALALMHDIGHPPFGHAGEKILNECCQACGGFNHNRHAVRIVTLLENRYPEFPGLNLTEEVLAGQQVRAEKHSSTATVQPMLEVQVVDAADSIAYDTHDADDALELGLLDFADLLSVPLWQEAAGEVRLRYANLEPETFRRTVIHHLIETLVSDVVESTRARLKHISTRDDAVNCETCLVAPSAEVAAKKGELESFLFEHVYRHPTVLAERAVASEAVRALFSHFSRVPDSLPDRFRTRLSADGASRSTCDFLASMTDRFALSRFRELG